MHLVHSYFGAFFEFLWCPGWVKKGRPEIPCPQWLRACKNHSTIWRCRTFFWTTGRPIVSPRMSRWSEVTLTMVMTLVDPSLILWRHLPLIRIDVTKLTSMRVDVDDDDWRYALTARVNDGSLGYPRSCCWPRVTLTCGDLLLGHPVVQKHVLHLHIVKWFLYALKGRLPLQNVFVKSACDVFSGHKWVLRRVCTRWKARWL